MEIKFYSLTLFLLMLLIGNLSTAQEILIYSSEECQMLGNGLLEALENKQFCSLVSEVKNFKNCPTKSIINEIYDTLRNRPECALEVACLLNLIEANLDYALEETVISKSTEAVAYLLEHGANIYGSIDISDEMFPSGEYIPLFHYAISKGYQQAVELFLAQGYDINRAHFGVTPLMFAAWHGQDDIVKLLLQRGACIDIRDFEGNTAFNYGFIGMEGFGWSRLEAHTHVLLEPKSKK